MCERDSCECQLCCDGEHSGHCNDCAGWGDFAADGSVCEHCQGEGICPVCRGRCLPDEPNEEASDD